jgi:hypothetical protein
VDRLLPSQGVDAVRGFATGLHPLNVADFLEMIRFGVPKNDPSI